jgi:hypothetical protein
VHPYFVASASDATTLTIRGRIVGDAAYTTIVNALATTENMANTAWAAATCGTGTGNANPAVTSDAATFTIGTRVYTAVLEFSETQGATAIPDQILWVTTEAVFLDNIKKAINATGIAGTNYSTGTTINTQVEATTNADDSQIINTRLLGTAGNLIATSTTLANYAWTSTVMASGTGATSAKIVGTLTPAAGSNYDFSNVEFERGLFCVIANTLGATVVYK